MEVSATKRNQLFQEKKWLQVTGLQSSLRTSAVWGKACKLSHRIQYIYFNSDFASVQQLEPWL